MTFAPVSAQLARQLTSEVIGLEGASLDWCDESYLIVHEPIRWDLQEAERLLQLPHFDGTVSWKVENFFNWYRLFSGIVHHHHDVEEKIAFPMLAARCSVPPRMSSDHKSLLKTMDDIRDSQIPFAKAKDDSDRKAAASALRVLWKDFAATMRQHLAEEERVLTPLIRQYITPEEDKALVQQVLKDLGFSGNKTMLPWILRTMRLWKRPQELVTWMEQIPTAIRFLNENWWTYAYERDNWGLMHSLELDKPRESSLWDLIL